MSGLETALFAIFWNGILERFNATNKILQDPKMLLESVVRALESLKSFVESKRDDFDKYEEAAKQISNTDEYVQSRIRKRSVKLNPLDYMKAQDANLSPREKFKVSGFIPVIDQLYVSLTARLHAYEAVRSRFGFLNHLEMDAANLYAAAEELVKVYKDDLEPSLGGVIEAFPPSESITSLTANILITPENPSTNSKITIISVGDQIHLDNPFHCWGFSYPQTSVNGATLYKYVQDIAKQCLKLNIAGFVSIDFVTFIDEAKMQQIVWAVDLDISYSDCMACSEILVAAGLKFNLLGDSLYLDSNYGLTEERFAVVSLQLFNSRFQGISFYQFNQFCQCNDIILNKQAIFGSLIFPVSSTSLKYFGMVTINSSLKRALNVFSSNLSILRKFNKSSKQEEKNNFREIIQKLQNISELITENIKDSQL